MIPIRGSRGIPVAIERLISMRLLLTYVFILIVLINNAHI